MNPKTLETNPIEFEIFQQKLKQLNDLVETNALDINDYRVQRQLLLRCLEAQIDFNAQVVIPIHNDVLKNFQKTISHHRAKKNKVYGKIIFFISMSMAAVLTWLFLNENLWRSTLLNF